jgi:hypothetical protein
MKKKDTNNPIEARKLQNLEKEIPDKALQPPNIQIVETSYLKTACQLNQLLDFMK